MTNPGISLILPAFNASRYLREAVDSALNQTIPPRQLIVVDDGSTDDTLEIARGYGEPVTVITQPNAGTSAARNRGLAEANQPLISFLDADDRFMPDKLERQLQALSDHPDAMLCICRVRNFWSPDLPDTARGTTDLSPQFRPGQVFTWMMRREVLDQVGTFSMSPNFQFAEGSELYSRIESAGLAVVRIDDVLIERRLHAANKTTNTKAHLDGIMALMKSRLNMRRNSA